MATKTATPRSRPTDSRAGLRVASAGALRRVRRVPRALALLLLVGALQSVAWAVALPAFQGPDESAHFGYLQHLAVTGNLPSPTRGRSANSSEAEAALVKLNLKPLIGNLAAKPAWSSADLALWRSAEHSLPAGAASDGAGPNAIAKNPPLYYAVMAVPYRIIGWLPLLKRILLLRLFSALCYLATIALTWVIAADLFGRVRWKQALAAGAVALQPQLAFMSAVINADSLLIALTTGFLLAALRLAQRGPSTRRVLAASGLAAAACLTQGRGLVTLPVLLTALLASLIRHRAAAREALTAAAAAAGTLVAALGAYLLFGRSSSGGGGIYGGQAAYNVSVPSFNVRQFLSSIYQFYLPKLPSLQPRLGPSYGYRQVFIETFYGTFGSLEVIFPARLYDALQVLTAVGLVGFYTACVARWRSLRRHWPSTLVMLALLLTTVVFMHYVSYVALLGNGRSDPLIVGRYLLPMVALFGLAIAFTASALPRRLGPLLGAAILALGVFVSLGGIGITMSRFYG
jgi:4-amino-4-deoxy-L-arabinose transferase-like glycosyltransferase